MADGYGNVWGNDLDRTIRSVERWIEMVNEAGHAHDRLAPVVADYIEASANPDEILRFVPFMASLSSQARVDVESTLRTILVVLRQAAMRTAADDRRQSPGDPGGLRSVQ